MNLEKAVLVMSSNGEQLIGEIQGGRHHFDENAIRGLAVVLENVRRFDIRHVASPPNELGQAKVRVIFEFNPIEPFPYPVPTMHVRLTRWVHLPDLEDEQLMTMISRTLQKSETREQEMRASAAGIHLASSRLKGV